MDLKPLVVRDSVAGVGNGDMDLKPAAVDSVADVTDGDMDLNLSTVRDSVADVADGKDRVKDSDDSSSGVIEFCYITPELMRTFHLSVQKWEGKQPAPPLPFKEVVKNEPQDPVATVLDGNEEIDANEDSIPEAYIVESTPSVSVQSSPVASAQKTQSSPVDSAQKKQSSPVASVKLSPVASTQKSVCAGNSNWHRVCKTSSKFLQKQKDHTMFICPEESCTFPFHVHDETLPFLPHNEHNYFDYSQCWNCNCIRQKV
eukprot:14886820-Ditylum_brightwellii.AAC.1